VLTENLENNKIQITAEIIEIGVGFIELHLAIIIGAVVIVLTMHKEPDR
jgi:hypothetical protein